MGTLWTFSGKTGLREIQLGGVDWMHVDQNGHQWRDRVDTIVMNVWVPQKSRTVLTV